MEAVKAEGTLGWATEVQTLAQVYQVSDTARETPEPGQEQAVILKV